MTIDPPHVSASSQLRLMQVRETIRRQAVKDRFFPPAIFAGPAWPLYLGVCTAHLEGGEFSVAAACAHAAVPTVTALRWIDVLIEAGFLRRLDGNVDMRRASLGLTDKGVEAMDGMLDAMELD